MKTQPKLPGTLPTPAQARSALRLARDEREEKVKALASLTHQLELAKGEEKAASAEVERAERDLLASDVGSPEDIHATRAHLVALKRLTAAEDTHETLGKNLPMAKLDLKGAEERLRGARGDLRAIAEGRRK